MIIADLYVEKNGSVKAKPRTIIIWRVYARTDFDVAKMLRHHIKDETIVQGIIRRAHVEGRIAIKYKKTISDDHEYELWTVLTNNLAEVNKIYMQVDGIHNFHPSYGMHDAIDISQF